MSEPSSKEEQRPTALQDAMRSVRNAAADRDDVVIEMRDAERMRLEIFAQELQPVINEVSREDARFDFSVSSGLQPRFWIDAVSHVAMGRDRRTYRFVRDTRLGRVVLAESSEMKPVLDQVTRYVAERIVERQRQMEGDIVSINGIPVEETGMARREPERARAVPRDWSMLLGGMALIGAGAVAGLALALAYAWLRGINPGF